MDSSSWKLLEAVRKELSPLLLLVSMRPGADLRTAGRGGARCPRMCMTRPHGMSRRRRAQAAALGHCAARRREALRAVRLARARGRRARSCSALVLVPHR